MSLTKTTPRQILQEKRSTVLSISSTSFYKNLEVPEWKQFTNSELSNFVPFETFHTFGSRIEWMANHLDDMPGTFPKGYDIHDVRWMPTCHQPETHKGKTLAYMKYDSNHATEWHLALVAIHPEKHRLMLWDTKKHVWATFKIKDKILEKVLQPWIDW